MKIVSVATSPDYLEDGLPVSGDQITSNEEAMFRSANVEGLPEPDS